MSITLKSTKSPDGEWLLLLFFLPAKQAQARVQAWRRLQRLGAVSLKNSAYALPHSPEAREDFEWVRNEIVASGGQAMVLVARAPEPATSDEIIDGFRGARARDYHALATVASRMLKKTGAKQAAGMRREITQGVRRLRERLADTVRRDFFAAPGREEVEALLTMLDPQTSRPHKRGAMSAHTNAADFRGKVWLTRPRPGVDRMSSAWLIRRFIDPDATFVFANRREAPAAIPFDTFHAEFGHHGSLCTFETLSERFDISDAAVLKIGRIVHDLDLKETTYDEAESATIGRLVEGLRRTHADDDALLRSGIEMFEALYQSFTLHEARAANRPGLPARQAQRTQRRRRR
jgi:Uncharacterized conserved protein